jgi:hypothetical protein
VRFPRPYALYERGPTIGSGYSYLKGSPLSWLGAMRA